MSNKDSSNRVLSSLSIDQLSKAGQISVYTHELFLGHQKRILGGLVRNKHPVANLAQDALFWYTLAGEILERAPEHQRTHDILSQLQVPLTLGDELLHHHEAIRPDLQTLQEDHS